MERFNDPLVIANDPSPRYSPRITTRMSFDTALEFGIIEYIENSKKGYVTQDEIYRYFGDYPQTKNKVKDLCLKNIIRKDIIIADGRTKSIHLRTTSPELSTWTTLNACPCFTCTVHEECAITNPVSPVMCAVFNVWVASDLSDDNEIKKFLLSIDGQIEDTGESDEEEEGKEEDKEK